MFDCEEKHIVEQKLARHDMAQKFADRLAPVSACATVGLKTSKKTESIRQ